MIARTPATSLIGIVLAATIGCGPALRTPPACPTRANAPEFDVGAELISMIELDLPSEDRGRPTAGWVQMPFEIR
jgi:hypothetical protein